MNTFGLSSLKFPLCDPKDVLVNRERFGRDPVPNLEKVNTFYCPAGRKASCGYVLLPLVEFQQFNPYSSAFEMTVGTVVLKNLSIVRAQSITTGVSSDPKSLVLVELTDARGVLSNDWFKFPTNSQYNMRSPAYPQNYYSSSMNGGSAWTWNTMISDLWTQMLTYLGTYPGLPATPLGTPENYHFVGVSAWEALNDVLEHVGFKIACNPTSALPYTIVVAGAADTTFTSLQTLYNNRLLDYLDTSLDKGSGRVPKTVKVYFKIRPDQYGQEETVRRDSSQWTSDPVYTVSITSSYTSAVGVHYLWDDFTVRRDFDGVVNAADVVAASLIAQERVNQYYALRVDNLMQQTYAGALPFVTGSQVDSVYWENTKGWRTTITRGLD